MQQKAIFIDKDNTLIRDVPYNIDTALIWLTPGMGTALAQLQEAGFRILVVSNQAGVAKGYFKERDLEPVWQRLGELLRADGVQLGGVYYCPHHPEGKVAEYQMECECRKPEPGMLMAAAKANRLDLARSWMVGDIESDVEAGKRAGCRTIRFDYYADLDKEQESRADFKIEHADELAEVIRHEAGGL